MFLVVHDAPPELGQTPTAPPTPSAGLLDPSATLPATAVRVVPVPGGIRLTFAAAGPSHRGELVTTLAALVERERRTGGFLSFAVDVHSDGGAVSLTVTGPPALRREPR